MSSLDLRTNLTLKKIECRCYDVSLKVKWMWKY